MYRRLSKLFYVLKPRGLNLKKLVVELPHYILELVENLASIIVNECLNDESIVSFL